MSGSTLPPLRIVPGSGIRSADLDDPCQFLIEDPQLYAGMTLIGVGYSTPTYVLDNTGYVLLPSLPMTVIIEGHPETSVNLWGNLQTYPGPTISFSGSSMTLTANPIDDIPFSHFRSNLGDIQPTSNEVATVPINHQITRVVTVVQNGITSAASMPCVFDIQASYQDGVTTIDTTSYNISAFPQLYLRYSIQGIEADDNNQIFLNLPAGLHEITVTSLYDDVTRFPYWYGTPTVMSDGSVAPSDPVVTMQQNSTLLSVIIFTIAWLTVTGASLL